jgi:hypothetical protein
VGIALVSYFVYQTVGSPESTIINDARNKAEQLKQNVEQVKQNVTQGREPPMLNQFIQSERT